LIDIGVITDHHEHAEEEGHHHEGNRLETHQQPGSGSYDPIVGVAYSQVLGMFNLDSSAVHTIVNEGSQDTDLGDSFKYNLSFSYPVSGQLDLIMDFMGNGVMRKTAMEQLSKIQVGATCMLRQGFDIVVTNA